MASNKKQSQKKSKKKTSKKKKPGLWANIHKKRERIAHGSGEHMRKKGQKGAPSSRSLKKAQGKKTSRKTSKKKKK